MAFYDIDEALPDRVKRLVSMVANGLEQFILPEALTAAISRIADAVGKQHQQIRLRVPAPLSSHGMCIGHAEGWIARWQTLTGAVFVDNERMWMTSVGIYQLTSNAIDNAIECRD